MLVARLGNSASFLMPANRVHVGCAAIRAAGAAAGASPDGIICTGESYKNVVKLTFAKGASLKSVAPEAEEAIKWGTPL